MVRKHYRITRLRQTRKRPKTPAPNGTATRYQRDALLRLLAIPHIRTEKTWKLDAVVTENPIRT
jgi:hypothetical protein